MATRRTDQWVDGVRHEPLRVLFLMEGFEAGGAEQRFLTMARSLDPSRFAVRIGALRLGGPLEAVARAAGTEIVPFERGNRFDLSPALRLRRYLTAQGVAVVHAMHWLSNLTASLAAAGLPRVAVIGSTVGMVYDASNLARYRRWLDATLTWRRLDRMTVNTQALHAYLLKQGFPAATLAVVLNGVALPELGTRDEARRASREALNIALDAPAVGIVARLAPVKDHRTFLRAAHIVRRQLPAARFVIAGDGPERAALEALAHELELGDAVIFTGHVASSQHVLPALDAAVLCSRHEGMPNAVLEAGAWELPVVATAVGGVPEVVRDGQTGLLVPAGDAEMLAARLLDVLNDPAHARQMGMSAREWVAERFSTQRMMCEYEDLYQQVATERGWPATDAPSIS